MAISPATSHKWLVVKLADIGDLLTITPALSLLRATRPADTVHILTTAHSAPILPPDLYDEIILFDKFAFDRPRDLFHPANLQGALALARRLRRERYDTVLILHHLTTPFGAFKYAALVLASAAPRRIGLDNGRGWFLTGRVPDHGFGVVHEVVCWLQVVNLALGAAATSPLRPPDFPLRVRITAADRAWAAGRLPQGSRPRIAIHTGSGGYAPARRWDPLAFAAVADQLQQRLNAHIVLVGGHTDGVELTRQAMAHTPTDLSGSTTLPQLAAALEACDLFIGADSGVMHLAAAAGTPVLALFGPSNAAAWGPWSDRAVILTGGSRCSPCSYILSAVGQREGCPARTCMRLITPEAVVATAENILAGRNVEGATLSTQPEHHRLRILGVPVDAITWQDLRRTITAWITSDRPRQMCTVNPEFVMVAQQDINFYNILNRADLCVADGQGLLWAARYLGSPLPERITGSDGVPLIAGWAAEAGWSIFLLGAAEGVAARAAAILQETYPGLRIAGTYAGSPAPQDEDDIVARINASGADILFVAYGAPAQDKWIARNLPRLRVRVAAGVGGAFDFIAGVQKRAPLAWRRLGLEWLYRLTRQPWRWRRMTRLPRFVLAVLWRGRRGPARFEGPRR
ncbi:MAG: WecB/TagA/CpsF family glycosyltransferase [Anaerolineae bacterium]|nr:WecB/TagA/CpsF family glycosyltransferase [Anaerolineae bacterium]